MKRPNNLNKSNQNLINFEDDEDDFKIGNANVGTESSPLYKPG